MAYMKRDTEIMTTKESDTTTKRSSYAQGKNRKGRIAASLAVAVLMLLFVLLAMRGDSPFPGAKPQVWYWADDFVAFLAAHKELISILLAVLGGAYLYVRIPEGIPGGIFTAVAALLTPPAAFLLVEAYNRGYWHVGANLSYNIAKPFSSMFLLNLLLYYLFCLALIFLLGSIRLGSFVASAFLMLVAIANYYVVRFRGSPIVPWDLLSIRTAGNVAANYEYDVQWQMLFATFGFVYLLLSSVKARGRIRYLRVRIPGIILSLAALVMLVGSLQDDAGKTFWGIDTTLFTPNVRYTKNGFWPAWLSNISFLNVEKPDGYSPEMAEEIAMEAAGNTAPVAGAQAISAGDAAQETEGDGAAMQNSSQGSAAAAVSNSSAGNAAASLQAGSMPNIIVIMNEAFSDLAVLGDFETSEDYMPNFRELMDQYTSGHLLVSVKGGNTANTEYEFLSGDTMAFLPEGCVVFQQYIPGEIPTIATYLKDLGYHTTGMHPYNGSGWERDRVYPLMGFDEFLDITDFTGAEKLRNYVSDRGAFGKIIETIENKEEGVPQFIFQVTMQNHSGYTPKNTDNGFAEEIYLTDALVQTQPVVATERYLTLIKYSDQAFGELIDYFEENVTEPTIIVMFGDHEPGDYITQVIDDLVGNEAFTTASDNSGAADGTEESLEDVAKHYQVPFVIWNNFGLTKDESVDLMSVNYLGAYLLKQAGMPLSPAQEFLEQMRPQIPALAAGSYMDAAGKYHSWSGLSEDAANKDLINRYNIIEYNHLIDSKNRVDSIFRSGEQTQ